MVTRHCDGSDPSLVRQSGGKWVPCNCGLVFNDEHNTVTYPHQPIGGANWPLDRERHYRIQKDVCQATWNYCMRSDDQDKEKLYTEMLRAVMALRRFEQDFHLREAMTFPDILLQRRSGE